MPADEPRAPDDTVEAEWRDADEAVAADRDHDQPVNPGGPPEPPVAETAREDPR